MADINSKRQAAEQALRERLREYLGELLTPGQVDWLVSVGMESYHRGAIDALDTVQERQHAIEVGGSQR